ncbi:MAG: helix-turn-helix transcriptional regulator [Bryobacterales bacterium]|nr:helix-turn-helix transcriptional regulator [Bryobacterales bacterium]
MQTRLGKYSVVQAETPGQGVVNLGILLQEPETNALRLRFRRDLGSLSEEDLDVFSALAEDFAEKAQEMGAEKLFEYLESNASNAVRVTDREEILVEDFGRALDRLYLKNVQSNVLEFRTHLPRYSLRAAAGKFLENQEISEDGWVEAPEDLRLTPDMFVAEIAGHSMEPRIPDGSLCVFRYGVTGSRENRLVLAENLETAGNNRYAVKRYKSDKTKSEEWRHNWIRLESLNPDYPSWDLDPDEEKYRIIAEFVRVLD